MIDLDFGKTLLTIIMIKLGHDLNTLFISRIQVDLYVLNAAARKYLICCTMFVDLYTWFHLLLVSSIEREIFHKPVFLPKCISKMARFVCVMCTVSLSKKNYPASQNLPMESSKLWTSPGRMCAINALWYGYLAYICGV